MISIIVPVYNAADSVRECIDSVVCQDYANIELILIDDGSADNSYDICKEYEKKDNRIRVYHQANKGVSSARNLGINVARGEYIYFLDSDDRCKNVFRYCINVMKKEGADILVGGTDFYKNGTLKEIENANLFNNDYKIYEENKKEKLVRWIMERNISDFPELLVSSSGQTIRIGGVAAKLIKKRTIKSLRFVETLGYSEDLVFMYELFKKADKVVILGKSIYIYNYHENSATSSKYNPKIRVFNRSLSDYILNISTEYDDVYKNSMYEKMLNICWNTIVHGIAFNPNTKFNEKIYEISDEFKHYNRMLRNLKIQGMKKKKSKLVLFLCKYKLSLVALLLCYIKNKKGE